MLVWVAITALPDRSLGEFLLSPFSLLCIFLLLLFLSEVIFSIRVIVSGQLSYSYREVHVQLFEHPLCNTGKIQSSAILS